MSSRHRKRSSSTRGNSGGSSAPPPPPASEVDMDLPRNESGYVIQPVVCVL